MKTILSLILLALTFGAVTASAGVISGTKEVVKGVAKDTAVAVKTVAYPAVHPKKSLKATGKAVHATGKAVSKL